MSWGLLGLVRGLRRSKRDAVDVFEGLRDYDEVAGGYI